MIVNAMRAGFSFQAALKFCGDEIPAPLGDEFTRVYDEQRLGSDMRQALLGDAGAGGNARRQDARHVAAHPARDGR